jgi:hypothetical protein
MAKALYLEMKYLGSSPGFVTNQLSKLGQLV